MSGCPSPVPRIAIDRRPASPTLGRLLAFLVAAMPAAAYAQGLAPEERRIVDHVDGLREEPIALLERVVNIDSATRNLAGVREVGEVFRAEFDRLGFETRWDEMPPEMRRAGHLVAERKGAVGKRLLLIGHLDTVLEGGRFARRGPKATGSGALDMKGGDVILLYALEALHGVGALEGRRIVVVLTGDEEDVGSPIGPEPQGPPRSGASQRRRAGLRERDRGHRDRGTPRCLDLDAERLGRDRALLPDTSSEELGGGAIFEAARILDAFRREVPEEHLTINPSVLVGGTTARYDGAARGGTAEGKTNVIPARAIVEGDLRFLSEDQKRRAREAMRKIVGRGLPRTEATITFADEYPAMAPTQGNHELLAALDRASRDLGLGGVKAHDPGLRGCRRHLVRRADGRRPRRPGREGGGGACPGGVGGPRFPRPPDQAGVPADLPAHSPLNRSRGGLRVGPDGDGGIVPGVDGVSPTYRPAPPRPRRPAPGGSYSGPMGRRFPPSGILR